MNAPMHVQEQVAGVLREAVWNGGFALQQPLHDNNFYCMDSESKDSYLYKNTLLIELVRHDDGGYEILEYI